MAISSREEAVICLLILFAQFHTKLCFQRESQSLRFVQNR